MGILLFVTTLAFAHQHLTRNSNFYERIKRGQVWMSIPTIWEEIVLRGNVGTSTLSRLGAFKSE